MAVYSYKDIDLTFTKKRDGDINDFSSINAVRSSLKNILETMKGRRRMLPEFASGIWEQLFEPMDEITAYSLGEEIFNAIEIWDSRILVSNINVTPNYDQNRYDISITFSIRSSRPGQMEILETILERG